MDRNWNVLASVCEIHTKHFHTAATHRNDKTQLSFSLWLIDKHTDPYRANLINQIYLIRICLVRAIKLNEIS